MITEEILSKIQKEFISKAESDGNISSFRKKLKEGKASLEDVHDYAARVGGHLSGALQEAVTEEALPDGMVTRDVAEGVLVPTLKENHDLVMEAASEVLESMDEKTGIGLKPIQPAFDRDRALRLAGKAAEQSEDPDILSGIREYILSESLKWFGEPVVNNTESCVDNFVKENAKFRYNSGLKTTITRKAVPSCCDWCSSIAGTYDYAEIRSGDNIFRRHHHCRCTVTFQSGKTRQDIWSKRKWTEDSKDVERRKAAGVERGVDPDKIEGRKHTGKEEFGSISAQESRVLTKWRLSASVSNSSENTIREEIGFVPVDRIEDAIDFFRNEIRNKDVEHAIVIDSVGNVVHFVGGEKGVNIYGVELDGSHILHNHPISNGLVSFGEDDFDIYRANPTAIYDLCNAEYDYHLEVLSDISKLTYTAITHYVPGSVIEDLSNSKEDFQHLVMQEFCARGYIKYERKRKTR